MRHYPAYFKKQRAVDSAGLRRKQNSLVGTTPTVSSTQSPPYNNNIDLDDAVEKAHPVRRGVLQLLGLGLLLELIYLACSPLLAGNVRANDPVAQALPGLFPWLPKLYWTYAWPQLLSRLPWLNPINGATEGANLLLVLFVLATIALLLAARIGDFVAREFQRIYGTRGQLLRSDLNGIFWTIIILTAAFGLTLLLSPISLNAMSQDMLLSALYGRMVVIYHVNPYVIPITAFPHDVLGSLFTLAKTQTGGLVQSQVASSGPVWTDLSLLVTLFAHDSVANMLISFRFIALVAHLINIFLLWNVLSRLKPEVRISAALLYAWNPLILLVGIAQVHQEIVVGMLVLLAIFFFQRNSPILSWVFLLLAALVNPLYLLLLPLFLRLLQRRTRLLSSPQRMFWWLGMLVISVLVIVLAYAPYWQGWGITGLGTNILAVFWHDHAINSLDAALLNLPLQIPPVIAWLTAPVHWMTLTLFFVGAFLLFALWLADTPELVLMCCCWLLLLFFAFTPVYWPWYLIPLFILALCSANRHTILFAFLMMLGSLLGYYFELRQPLWSGQGLLTIGVPCLLWGWIMFFTSSWRRSRGEEEEEPLIKRITRPPRFSRPSRPSRAD